MTDLTNHLQRYELVLQIQKDIDQFCRDKFSDEPRTHLGASIIGNDCKAYSWNVFRWLKQEAFSGQMLRLFNRGHLEEFRFVEWLKGIGFQVKEIDEETGKQFRISGCKGHFGGSLDSILIPPEKYNLGPMVWLGEFKTHNEKSFTKLAGKPTKGDVLRTGGEGVRASKPQHFRQMAIYGVSYGFRYGLYCAVNKNTDELYFEIVELDLKEAGDLSRKAESIIFSQVQPMKIAQTATFFNCSYCHFSGICHNGESPEKNCRSCSYARPVENGQWWCDLHSNENGGNIPVDFIKRGCDNWARII